MANMTRVQFETELRNRGWGRFAAADLQRYINWGRDAVARAFKWRDIASGFTVEDFGANVGEFAISFATLDPDGIRSILRMWRQDVSGGELTLLKPITDDEYYQVWGALDAADPANRGPSTHYYVYNKTVQFFPYPDKDYHWVVDFIPRAAEMTDDGHTSGLPEQLDQAVLLEAEAYCFQRAHEFERMAVAQAEARRIVVEEMGDMAGVFAENHPQVIPYR